MAIEVERAISGLGVIRTDNGQEFCGKAMLAWAYEQGVQLRLIQPGKPNQNAYIESFNARLRDVCLNEHWFTHLLHARAPIETGGGNTTRNNRRRPWRTDANRLRQPTGIHHQPRTLNQPATEKRRVSPARRNWLQSMGLSIPRFWSPRSLCNA